MGLKDLILNWELYTCTIGRDVQVLSGHLRVARPYSTPLLVLGYYPYATFLHDGHDKSALYIFRIWFLLWHVYLSTTHRVKEQILTALRAALVFNEPQFTSGWDPRSALMTCIVFEHALVTKNSSHIRQPTTIPSGH